MKLEKWTLALAAVGAVSLAAVAQAQEKQMSAVQTALSSTTLSGYVDVSAHWNLGTGTGDNAFYRFGADKDDGFNLNVVQVSLSKPMDETDWAAGYNVDLWLGPDANVLNTVSSGSSYSDVALKQAYVVTRVPVQNGLDVKMGVFDSVVGYESVESWKNPNYTRSYGHSIEPQTHTGVLGSYRVSDCLSVSAGVANTIGPTINDRAHWYGKAESYKTYMGSVALTAPDSMGFLAGSILYAGVVNGFNRGLSDNQTSWYVGATLNTPMDGLKLGAAWDVLDQHNGAGDAWAVSVYASYQATEKMSLHGRAELYTENTPGSGGLISRYTPGADNTQIWALTGTVQYDLWENVLSRVEVRWDHCDEGKYFTSDTGLRRNNILIAANLVYKF